MTIGLITITHNRIGEQIADTAEEILGPPAFSIRHFVVGSDDDPGRIESEVVESINAMDVGDGVLIVADLYGSTPYHIARRVAPDHHVRVLSGLNLPMMLRIYSYVRLDLDSIARKAAEGARIGVIDSDVQPEGD
ncbi:MAG: PTS fructose transporter subunit IIA [Halofilum sp. (in: g-proteobacteria)]|nr:PTS fructose transporter subunit IIA [Halofilum sp. (in: g-proteobacteria)]